MKKQYVIFFLVINSITLSAQNIYKQESPEWLVHKFFSASAFPDKSNYFIDEMSKQVNYPSIGEELKDEASISIREIELNNEKSVFSVNIKKQDDQKDFYCYLKNQNGWKISAIRTFIIPAYYHQLADSIMNDPYLPDSTKSIAYSIRLILNSDEELKDYLKINFKEFQNLLVTFRNEPDSEIQQIFHRLRLSSIYKPDQLLDCYYFSIIEINYLEAGYIFCPEKSNLPEINPNDFIIVEEIVKDWYLFRRN
jgi:hypothetical protein